MRSGIRNQNGEEAGGDTRSSQRSIVAGVLDQVTYSRRTFVLHVGSATMRGTMPENQVGDYCRLLGEKVVVEGEVTSKTGTASNIEAKSIRPATLRDSIWEREPQPRPIRLDDLHPRNPLPQGESGFARIFNRWPGDETDEQIEAAIAELS